MKKLTKKQIIIIALAAVLVAAAGILLLSSGGSGTDDGNQKTAEKLEPPKTTEELMDRASTELSSVDSFQMDTDMTMKMKSGEETMDVSALVTCFYKKDAPVQKLISTMTMGNMGSYSTTTYTEKDGDAYNVYNSVDGGIEWTKETGMTEESLPISNPTEDIIGFFSDAMEYEKGESEEIGGVKTTRYDCVLSAEEMKETLGDSGFLSQLGGDLSEDTLSEVYEDLDGIEYSVWIGDEDYLPYRLYMDLGNMMRALSQVSDIGEDQKELMSSLEGVTITYDISNYNKLEEIEVPKEAKNAKEAQTSAE